MLERIDEISNPRVAAVRSALERVFGQVQGQRAVGPEDAEAVLLQPRRAILGAPERCDIGRREDQVRRLREPDGIVARAPRLAESRPVGMQLLEQTQRREQRERIRLVAQAVERAHRSGRVPVRTGQRFTSPRVADRTRVWANELSVT